MAGWLEGGVHAYFGITRCGKTTRAEANAIEGANARRVPVVVLDLASSLSFAHLPHAANVQEVLTWAFVYRRSPRIWTPTSEAERGVFWKMVRYFGGVEIIVDEIRVIADAYYIESAFVSAAMMWGHGKYGPARYHITAQRPAYLNRSLWPALDVVYVHRLAKGADAKRVEEELGVPRELSTTLPRGAYVPVEMGFPPESEEAEGGDAPPGDVLRDADAFAPPREVDEAEGVGKPLGSPDADPGRVDHRPPLA